MNVDLRNSLLAKVAAIFLVVLLALTILCSVGSLAIAYESGFYRRDNQPFEETEMFQNMAYGIAVDIALGYWHHGSPYTYVTGVHTVIRDAGTGNVLLDDTPESYQTMVSFEIPTASLGSPPEGESPQTLGVDLYFNGYEDVYGYNMEAYYLFYQLVYPIRDSLAWIAIFSIIGFFAVLVFLLCAAGHRRGSAEIVPNWLDRVPLDLFLVAAFFLGALNVFMVADLNAGGWVQIALILLLCLPLLLLALATLMTLATRLKLGRLWENTVCWRLGRWLLRLCRVTWHGLWEFIHILPFTWRSLLAVLAVLIAEFFLSLYANWDGAAAFFLLLLDGVLLAGTALFSWQLQKLKTAGQELANGNLEAKVYTKGMFWDIKTHAENLNAIGEGMNRAVEQRMKSERLKTELITNVSHDIKTPLTSIVNYVDLLKKEELPDTATEYLAVLDRQSSRLKKLTEDLVEASKASTGNIAVQLQPLVINEIILQAVGEYDQKLTAGKLEVIINTFEGNLSAMADSRLLWRVLDNLLSNVCKYAMAGSRVYIDLGRREGRVALSMKNISRDPLNISADELMERFVRGDSSRHAEGSGLGLNIAKSLVELMGGTFSLAVDGDLFKAELTLPEA